MIENYRIFQIFHFDIAIIMVGLFYFLTQQESLKLKREVLNIESIINKAINVFIQFLNRY